MCSIVEQQTFHLLDESEILGVTAPFLKTCQAFWPYAATDQYISFHIVTTAPPPNIPPPSSPTNSFSLTLPIPALINSPSTKPTDLMPAPLTRNMSQVGIVHLAAAATVNDHHRVHPRLRDTLGRGMMRWCGHGIIVDCGRA